VQANDGALEYCGTNLNTLFAQRSNILRPSFHRMIRDILRFNRQAVIDIQDLAAGTTVAEYLASGNYSADFADNYLVPMSAAIWSAEPGQVLDMPLHFLVRFFHNHGLLQIKDRPTWYTIEGGSREYVN
jgi:predicted NAD/FAD-binding protein